MKRLILIFILVPISFVSFSQFENFDLTKYKLPDIKRQQLDFKFDFKNSFLSQDFNVNKTSSFNMAENIEIGYNYFQNSREFKKYYTVYFDSDIDLKRAKENEKNPIKKENVNSMLLFNLDNYYYLVEDKWFVHFQPEANISYYKNKEKYLNFDKNDFLPRETEVGTAFPNVDVKSLARIAYCSPSVSIGYGYGRLEPVGDVRHAVYILEDLYKNNRLNKIPGEIEIHALAKKISELKNQRFFDSRLRKIYEIGSIDSLLNILGAVEKADAVYFTSLSDMWDYGSQERGYGNRVLFDLTGDINYKFSKYYYKKYSALLGDYEIVDSSDKEADKSLGATIRFNSDKPIGLRWQRHFNLTAFTKYLIDNATMESYYLLKNQLGVYSAYQLSWYLNTRTLASFNASFGYTRNKIENHKNYDIVIDNQLYTGLSGNMYYYLSPRLRLSFNSQLNYFRNGPETGSNLYKSRFSLSNFIGISYAIF